METTANEIVQIVGFGNRADAIRKLSQIMAGYAQFAAWKNSQEPGEELLQETAENLEVLKDLVVYVANGTV